MMTLTLLENKPSGTASRRNRGVLVLLMLLFVLPVVAATLLYLTGWRPVSSGNHGELIQPARQIEDLSLQTLDGRAARFSELRGKWTMAYFGASSCPEACMKTLYHMRQVHTAQGKESGRVERVWILADTNGLLSWTQGWRAIRACASGPARRKCWPSWRAVSAFARHWRHSSQASIWSIHWEI